VDHIPALRISVGLAIPMAVLLLTDHVAWAMYVGFGAFTGIYSRYEPTRLRFRRQSLAALMLTACVTLGASLARLGESMDPTTESWTTLLVSSLVAGLAAALVLSRGLKPGGAIFPLFAVAAVASAPPAAPVAVALLVAAATAALCVGLGLLGHWMGERHPGAGGGPATERWTARQLGAEFSRFASASAIAGVLGLLSGLPFPYWAQIAAIALLSAPGRTLQVERGLHRVIGTTLGIVTTAFLLSFPSEPWQLVVWVVVLQFLAEMYVLRNYAFALLFVTPLALLMVQLAHPQPAGPMLRARVLETAIGVVVGIAVVVVAALADRRTAARAASGG
jgi:Fusaric acid resistance protein-like